MFFNASGPSNFLTIGFLHLGVEMDDNNITLNCLIVPIGKLMNIPCIKVMQSITIRRSGNYSDLETAIQSRLGAPFNQIQFKPEALLKGKWTCMRILSIFLMRNLKQSTS